MQRRQVIRLLGGAALARPLVARARQVERISKVGALLPYGDTDAEAQSQMTVFRNALDELGRTPGRGVQIDERWAAGDFGVLRRAARQLVALRPDVIISRSTAATAALLYETRTLPVVFLLISDPVGDGFVVSMARPGGHATGFADAPASVAGDWLRLLKEIAPGIKQIAVLVGTGTAPDNGSFYLRSVKVAAEAAGVTVTAVQVKNAGEIEQDLREFASGTPGALIVTPDMTTTLYRSAIISATMRYGLPAVYPFRFVAAEGGLASYGVDVADQYRHAAGYVDRILKGAKPRELPVQAPTKFELTINLKTAKALGLEVPPALLARADGVIEG